MEKHQNKIFWAILLSEGTHIFCCVLPTVFSLLSLFAGIGLISVVPSSVIQVHDLLHNWEVPMLIISGLVLLLGWGLHFYSRKIDCHDTGCAHGACKPKKNKALIVLQLASVLFIVNLFVYGVFHRNSTYPVAEGSAAISHDHDHHNHGHAH